MKYFYNYLITSKIGGGGKFHVYTLLLTLFLASPLCFKTTVSAQQKTITINGVVLDEAGKPMPGVTVLDNAVPTSGTTTNAKGAYAIIVSTKCDSLRYSFIGYKTLVQNIRDAALVRMSPTTQEIGDVVVTGIYTRKAESYTGAATTIGKTDLLRVGNQNILRSLKNIDPTIYIPDNMMMGSDPNSLPSISMRGTTSFPTNVSSSSLRSNYENQPNQPLFILDGFETTAQTVMDMDMNRIESLTILKDASAKALYGSKAANGVIVIETKRLVGNQQLVTYTGSVSLSMPDLTSYDLCNSLEKLQVELVEGIYTSTDPQTQIGLTQKYNARKKLALEGLDTYWLSKPLRTGVGHKHNINVELGNTDQLRTSLDFSYNDVAGVMKGSGRTDIEGNVNVSYRLKKKFIFRNIMSIISNKSSDSPYGSYSEYSKMNPFWKATDNNGNILRWAEGELINASSKIPNPMYDATVGTSFLSSYLKFTNNFYAEWMIIDGLKATARIGVSQQRDDSDNFYPAFHSSFASYTSDTEMLRRGRYILENGKRSSISGDFNVNYSKTFGKHTVFANAGFSLSETKFSTYMHTAEGFPNNEKADISFARQYALNSRPVGSSSINREVKYLGAASYDYDNRYLLDLSLTMSASSLFGANNRWSSNWGVGVGWNVHNEAFFKNQDVLKQLKIRASVGVTGNQNFLTNSSIATFSYYTGVVYQHQTGAYLTVMPNPDLKWEQRKDYNIGVDLRIHRLNFTFDYYRADTENMLTDLTIPSSTGFSTTKANLGLVRNNGFEARLNYTLWQSEKGFFNIYGNIAHNKNKIIRLSKSLQHYNDLMKKNAEDTKNSVPVLMYEDGRSMTAIWAVPSAGIDPGTGQEVYIKRDGSLTYTYNASDLVVAGDTEPTYRGNFGFSTEYKGIGLNVTMSYLGGGQMYNHTLVDRVENIDINYNVDRRVLLGRWQYVGQEAQFKRLGNNERTRATSRFVQNRNELSLSSISLYYDFPRKVISKMRMERLRFTCYVNDVATFSSIKVERGLNYPFARTMSFSLTATF